MNFEIYGVGFVNKGAELMMHSIIHQIRHWDPKHVAAVNLKTGNYTQRSELGLYTIPWGDYKRAPLLGEVISKVSQQIPKQVLFNKKIIPYSDIDVIFDASGFAYSDEWGTDFISDLLIYSNKWRADGKRIIFLPQAFGPFNIKQNQLNMREIINNAELIYARDVQSLNHLYEIEHDNHKIKLAPDFTNLLEGKVPDYIDQYNNLVCLVPNSRMVDKTNLSDKETYINLFQRIAHFLIEHDYDVVILIHEKNDQKLGEELFSRIRRPINLICENNPLMLKGLIGQSKLVIGSRYHALISSLSQGIPALGTSWSHKYQELFEDYECSECLIVNFEGNINLEPVLYPLLLDPSRSKLIERINNASREQKKQSKIMWREIFHQIFN